MPQFPIQTEGAHPAEFVLSEANGQRSRENAFLAHPITIPVGALLTAGAAATTDKPQTYTLATTGANAHAVALYGGVSVPVDGLRISIIARDAELNEKLVNFGAMSEAEKATARTTLAGRGIVLRT
jgi:Bacteriophage lambda head decoration protein D